jgi:hypothetical protein
MSGRTIAIVVALVLALVLVLGATGCCSLLEGTPAEAEEAGPTILIDSPSHGDEVTVDEEVQVFATGQDANKIARMELWVDGSMVQSQASALPDGTNPFPIMVMWVPDTPGNHTIVVRGYNTNDVSGQASVAVNAVEAAPPEIPEGCEGVDLFDHQVQIGETLEGIAGGYELTAEQILACNPGLDPAAPLTPGDVLHIPAIVSPEEEGPPPDWPPPADAEEPLDVPEDVEELPGEELPPAEEEAPPGEEAPPEAEEEPEIPEEVEEPEVEEEVPPPVTVTFEALELEADQAYDNVYCMVWLADADMEQVPETGSFAPVVDNYWDIQAELAGMNSVPVPVSGDIFRVEVECFGWIGIEGWSLGHFVREHGEAEWTGDEIEVQALADDGRWFRVVYRICPDFPCEPLPGPDAPENLTYFEWHYPGPCGCIWDGICLPPCPPPVRLLGWDWSGDETTIDGFRVYRNDGLVYQIENPAAHLTGLTAADTQPPCGETYSYHVTAYQGPPGVGPESPPSNIVDFVGEPCLSTVVITFEELHTGCMHADPCFDITCATCDVPNFKTYAWANGTTVQESHLFDPVDITSYSVIPMSDILTGGRDTLTVELATGDDLTIGVRIRDWDFFYYEDLLEGARTILSDDVATGDYFLVLEDPPGPYVANGVVLLHLEVTP